MQEKFIDIEKIIKGKSNSVYKVLPGYLLKYLKRILHQDQLNDLISRNINTFNLDFIKNIIEEFGARVNTKGMENIPEKGKFLITANHPLGGLDGIALINSVGRIRKDIKIIVNDLLLNVENLKGLFVPVNKFGGFSKDAVKSMEEIFESDNLIITFPFGLVSRKRKNKIEDIEWKKNFLVKSKLHNRSIIPVHIDGQNSNFFYNLANLRKVLGIRMNIEMFFLVDEMYKQQNRSINITIGKPIDISTFDNRFSDVVWSEKLRKYVYSLSLNSNAVFQTD